MAFDPIRTFSQSNPPGPEQGDVAKLLRTVANTLEDFGVATVMDLVMHTEVTADGPWPSITVYYEDPEFQIPSQ
ncbi:hypothetical protein H0264_11195 [Nocardia huaxiensis]|uniref:Uncharacterized protein n=1 Tax=Nocardia huaxiensis TaxID=2755382 RepID=A0A7D6ZUK9_9NOCA|nr:hypothetical protein H0264_11195 [Nocardia huaxiensis]